MLTHIYPAVDRLVKTLLSAAKILHEGLWLGLFNHDALKRLSIRQYGAWERYNTENHNLSGLFPWEAAAIDRMCAPGGSVLVAATGGGREVLALRKLGFHADGFECQPQLAARARALLDRENLSGEIFDAAPDQVPAHGKRYDALIVGWGAYIHILGRTNRIRFMQQFLASAPAGAPCLVSFFARSPSARRFGAIHRIATFARRLRLSQDPVELGDILDGTLDHYFTEAEIREELEQAGLTVEYYTESPFAHVIARTGTQPSIQPLPSLPG